MDMYSLVISAIVMTIGFKILSSIDRVAFMQPNSEKTYGISPEQVVGSRIIAKFKIKDGKPALIRQLKITSSMTMRENWNLDAFLEWKY